MGLEFYAGKFVCLTICFKRKIIHLICYLMTEKYNQIRIIVLACLQMEPHFGHDVSMYIQ